MIIANITEEALKEEDTLYNLNTNDVALNSILEQNRIDDLRKIFFVKKFFFSYIDSIKYAAKGIPFNYYNQIKQEDWLKMLDKQQFRKLLEGSVTNNAIKIERDFVTGIITVLSPNINISNSSVDNSRLRIFDNNNKWVNTKPLLINENSRISLDEYHLIRVEKENQIKNYKQTNTKKKYFNLLKQEIEIRKLEEKQKNYFMNIFKMFKAKYFNKSTSNFKQLPKDQLFTTYKMDSYKLEVLIILRLLESIGELTQVSLKKIQNQLETLVRDDLRKFDQDYEKYVDFLLNKSS